SLPPLPSPPSSTPFPTRRSSDLTRSADACFSRSHRFEKHEAEPFAIAWQHEERAAPIPGGQLLVGHEPGEPHRVGAARSSCCQRSEEHTSELQSRRELVCRLLLE